MRRELRARIESENIPHEDVSLEASTGPSQTTDAPSLRIVARAHAPHIFYGKNI